MLKFRVWQATKTNVNRNRKGQVNSASLEERFFYHGINGGNVTIPCSESDGYATEGEAHRAVLRLWKSFFRAAGMTQEMPPPYARDSPLKPAKVK